MSAKKKPAKKPAVPVTDAFTALKSEAAADAKDAARVKRRRPPRQVFIVCDESGEPQEVRVTRKASLHIAAGWQFVAGPYVLAERVRNR